MTPNATGKLHHLVLEFTGITLAGLQGEGMGSPHAAFAEEPADTSRNIIASGLTTSTGWVSIRLDNSNTALEDAAVTTVALRTVESLSKQRANPTHAVTSSPGAHQRMMRKICENPSPFTTTRI